MIVADRDGAVVVPFERIDEIAAKVAHIAEVEAERDAKVAEGLKALGKVAELLESDQVMYVDQQ